MVIQIILYKKSQKKKESGSKNSYTIALGNQYWIHSSIQPADIHTIPKGNIYYEPDIVLHAFHKPTLILRTIV